MDIDTLRDIVIEEYEGELKKLSEYADTEKAELQVALDQLARAIELGATSTREAALNHIALILAGVGLEAEEAWRRVAFVALRITTRVLAAV